MRKYRLFLTGLTALLTPAIFAGCQPSAAPSSATPTVSRAPKLSSTTSRAEQPVTPEKNPPGDIPDTQAFITYTSSIGRYAVEAPEGWARTQHGQGVSFVSRFDGESVTLTKSATRPDLAKVKQILAPRLQQTGRAVAIQRVQTKSMPRNGRVTYVTYTSNSDPDPVTSKQLRLDNAMYFFYRQGLLATLTLWAPAGADNVDQWKRISESFRWL